MRERKQNTGAKPVDRIQVVGSLPLSHIVGKKIVGLYAVTWNSDLCNLAQFIFKLDSGQCVTWDEIPLLHICRECQLVEFNCQNEASIGVVYDNPNDSLVFGQTIVDMLMPVQEEDRHPGSYVMKLSSGYGLVQSTGEPIGILPAIYLADLDQQQWVSMLL